MRSLYFGRHMSRPRLQIISSQNSFIINSLRSLIDLFLKEKLKEQRKEKFFLFYSKILVFVYILIHF